MQKKYRLMTPGPVSIHPDVLREISQPAIHHRTPQFEKILKDTLEKLQKVFQTTQKVYLHTSTGSGAMESAIVNTLSPKDKVIVIVSGKFGERWLEMCRTYDINAIELKVSWGECVDPQTLSKLLQQNPDTKAVFTQACETSTAVLHPIKEIAKIVAQHQNTILVVDAITALGATPLPMDEWGLDVVIAGSQKVFMLPTGLSFIAASQKAWKHIEAAKLPRYYFDLRKEKKANEKGETYFSSAVSHIRGLNVVLDLMLKKTLSGQFDEIQKWALATRAGMKSLGCHEYAKSPSPAVSAFLTPQGVDSQKLRKHIEDTYNVTVMGGQDSLQGKILRIGHIGYIQPEDILATIEAVGRSLIDFGVKVDVDSALAETRNLL